MNRVRRWSVSVVAVGIVLAWNLPVRSQVIIEGQHASDNVTGGAVAARAPGNMVNAGVRRAQEAASFARNGIEIVETTRPQSPRTVFLVDAIEIIFEQLNKTLLELGAILLQRAGLPLPTPPTTEPPADGTENSGDEVQPPADETENGVEEADVNEEVDNVSTDEGRLDDKNPR